MDARRVVPDVSREEFRELLEEVRALKERISALERQEPAPVPQLHVAPAIPDVHVSPELVPTAGRALLAIAGAYLLRAFTEWHFVPPAAGVLLGMLYAGFWLWRALRARSSIETIADAATATIIFAPLAWEATLNLHALPEWAAAAATAAFAIAPLRRREAAMIASSGGAAVAIALMVGSHDLLPFTIALLAIATAADWTLAGMRWVAAICADAAVGIMTMIVARPLPEGYAALTTREAVLMQAALFCIFAGGALYRTVYQARPFAIYEIAQTAIAFALSLGGLLYLTSAHLAVGIFTLFAGIVCYGISLRASQDRNVLVYATFGALLAGAGVVLISSGVARVAALATLAIAVAALPRRAFARWITAGAIHVPAFVWTAVLVSGAGSACVSALFDGGGDFPQVEAAIIVVAGIAGYFGVIHRIVPAVAVLAASLWCAAGIAASRGAGAAALIVMGTALVWIGVRWKRNDLVWLMYGCMILAGAKILFYDFSHQTTASLMVSLLVYGAALIGIPRILRQR
jgi:hypothetical protein